MKKLTHGFFISFFKKLNTRSIVSRHIQDWPKGIYALWSSVGKEQLNFQLSQHKSGLNFGRKKKKKIQMIIINKK